MTPPTAQLDPYRLQMAVADRFLTLRLAEDTALLPSGDLCERIAVTLGSVAGEYTIVLDCRDLHHITHDVAEFVETISPFNPTLLDYEDKPSWLSASLQQRFRVLSLRRGEVSLGYAPVDLAAFEPYADRIGVEERQVRLAATLSSDPPTAEEWNLITELNPVVPEIFSTHDELIEHWHSTGHTRRLTAYTPGGAEVLGRRMILAAAKQAALSSLLTQYSIQIEDGSFHIVPYHGYALNEIETQHGIVIARPAVLARRTHTLLSAQLRELEEILDAPASRESDVQHFLERYPQVFRAMGYDRVYSQVVLERDDGTSLIPDFIAEPIGSAWADILDLKRPERTNLVVGGRDRRTLASAIHQVAAQLREYAAYFEDPRLAKRVEERYGIRCYKPRLTAIVGIDPNEADERQQRRLMTQYSDVNVVTFDQLLRLAKSRLLI